MIARHQHTSGGFCLAAEDIGWVRSAVDEMISARGRVRRPRPRERRPGVRRPSRRATSRAGRSSDPDEPPPGEPGRLHDLTTGVAS